MLNMKTYTMPVACGYVTLVACCLMLDLRCRQHIDPFSGSSVRIILYSFFSVINFSHLWILFFSKLNLFFECSSFLTGWRLKKNSRKKNINKTESDYLHICQMPSKMVHHLKSGNMHRNVFVCVAHRADCTLQFIHST